MSSHSQSRMAIGAGGVTLFISRLADSLAGPRRPHPSRPPAAVATEDPEFAEARAALGWLSLSDDAGGHGAHAEDVTFVGLTPDDIDMHDANGGDLSWISLSSPPPGSF